MPGNGAALEHCAQRFFGESEDIHLERPFSLEIGASNHKKSHRFDLGSDVHRVLVECKSHTWTISGNSPAAKFSIWNEAMYFFTLAPSRYRKIMFVRKHVNPNAHSLYRCKSLAEVYLQLHRNLIPDGVELWEFEQSEHKLGIAKRLMF